MIVSAELETITKRFGSVEAVSGVSLSLETGKIHALVGENGAGKTTLMRVLYGAIKHDLGRVTVEGTERHFRSAADGIASGIGMVSQHYSIIPDLTCLENLILGAEPGYFLARTNSRLRAQELAVQMGFEFEWDAPASTLTPAGAQKLEILKLLWRNSKIMILDEPTAMLSPADSDALYASLKSLASSGATIIVVTHRLPEVLEHCDDITVLRGGKFVAKLRAPETNAKELAELIVGHAIAEPKSRDTQDEGSELLRVTNLTVLGERKNEAVRAASFGIRSGELVGIAGVDGSGQRELFWALCGLSPSVGGTIYFEGQDITRTRPAERIQLGLRVVPEDRHEEAVVEDWSLADNAAIGLQRSNLFAEGPWLRMADVTRVASQMAERFSTKFDSINQPIGSLSGGNQQRFVAGRALAHEPRLVLAFQPTRGLDIDATRAVFDGIREACDQGAAALVVSFDLDELLEQCDRVIAMNEGRVLEPAPGHERDRTHIGQLMVGAR